MYDTYCEIDINIRLVKVILHLYDNTNNPKRSQQNATEPIYLDRNEHVIELFCGEGMQSIKWLTLAAAGRLKHLRKNTMTGRVTEKIMPNVCDILYVQRLVEENSIKIMEKKK